MALGLKLLGQDGSHSCRANGAITVGRGVAFSTQDSENRQRVVQASVSKNATLSSVSRPAGIAKNTAADGGKIEYYAQPGMQVIVQAGAVVGADKDVMIDGNGKFIEASSTAGQYTQIWGHSVEAAAADGDYFTIQYSPSIVGSAITAGADLAVTGNETVGGTVDVTGDITAAGGFRRNVGFWFQENVAASQASVKLKRSAGVAAGPWVADRAGSLVGMSGSLSVAAAGSDLLVKVFKNGSLLHTNAKITFASGTSDTVAYATFAKDTYTFAAGDYLEVVVISDGSWTATTADLGVDLEVEM